MVTATSLYEYANRMRKRDCRDIRQLAKDSGIEIIYRDNFKDLLGMYVYAWRHRMIFLNDRMDPVMERMVIAHEMGHDRLHRDLARETPLKEFVLFDMKDTTEYEANAYASHLLLPDEEVIAHLKDGLDIAQTASAMNVNINLLLIKLTEMNRLGMQLPLPFEPDGAFFRRIQV